MKRVLFMICGALLLSACTDSSTNNSGYITLRSDTKELTIREGAMSSISVTASEPDQVHTDLGGTVYCLTYLPKETDSKTSSFVVYGQSIGTAMLTFYCYSIHGTDTLKIPLTVLPQDVRSVEITVNQYTEPIEEVWATLKVRALDAEGMSVEIREITWEIADPIGVRILDEWIDVQPNCIHDQYGGARVYRNVGRKGTSEVTAIVNGVRSNTVTVSTQ